MTTLCLNKPFQVICQFRPDGQHRTLAEYITTPHLYPAGRLDHDSEGLLILTDDGALQHRLSDPRYKLPKRYWAQVEGVVTETALAQLRAGVILNDGPTRPAEARHLTPAPELWPRTPPIRYRATRPTDWLELTIREGRNRQVRRMTAAVGLPTLRLIRVAMGPLTLGTLQPGESRSLTAAELKLIEPPC